DCFFFFVPKPQSANQSFTFKKHNSPLSRLEQKTAKIQNGVRTLSKRRFIFPKRRFGRTKWRFVLFVFLLRLIEKHKILSSKQKNIILLLLR
ncbi:MAG: hypothetical protein SPK15_04995, partial [Candidatus Onthomorpha sp.]|nr:hypothetical protein [Candidatus Onthomorpha sp.]